MQRILKSVLKYSMENTKFDVVIIGSGMGGLCCGLILSKEGYKVCILEKNRQLGGSLQIFSRDKVIFDTGIHYIGGLDNGQNLNSYFKYLGLMDKIKLRRMEMDGFDHITFKGDPIVYKHAQGYENFISVLSVRVDSSFLFLHPVGIVTERICTDRHIFFLLDHR